MPFHTQLEKIYSKILPGVEGESQRCDQPYEKLFSERPVSTSDVFDMFTDNGGAGEEEQDEPEEQE